MLSALKYYALPLALTAVIEAFAALPFGFKRKEQRMLLLVNCLTNPAANLLLFLFVLCTGRESFIFIALLEAAIVVAEAAMLRSLCEKKRPYLLLSALFNAASYFLGTQLLELLPL